MSQYVQLSFHTLLYNIRSFTLSTAVKIVKYHTSDSKHLTVIPAFVWTISSEQQHQCTSMIIDKHQEYLHTFQKGNEQAINTIFIQFYFK